MGLVGILVQLLIWDSSSPQGFDALLLSASLGVKLVTGFSVQGTLLDMVVVLRGAAPAQSHNRSICTCQPGGAGVTMLGQVPPPWIWIQKNEEFKPESSTPTSLSQAWRASLA